MTREQKIMALEKAINEAKERRHDLFVKWMVEDGCKQTGSSYKMLADGESEMIEKMQDLLIRVLMDRA